MGCKNSKKYNNLIGLSNDDRLIIMVKEKNLPIDFVKFIKDKDILWLSLVYNNDDNYEKYNIILKENKKDNEHDYYSYNPNPSLYNNIILSPFGTINDKVCYISQYLDNKDFLILYYEKFYGWLIQEASYFSSNLYQNKVLTYSYSHDLHPINLLWENNFTLDIENIDNILKEYFKFIPIVIFDIIMDYYHNINLTIKLDTETNENENYNPW